MTAPPAAEDGTAASRPHRQVTRLPRGDRGRREPGRRAAPPRPRRVLRRRGPGGGGDPGPPADVDHGHA